jgi:hypothetical protein
VVALYLLDKDGRHVTRHVPWPDPLKYVKANKNPGIGALVWRGAIKIRSGFGEELRPAQHSLSLGNESMMVNFHNLRCNLYILALPPKIQNPSWLLSVGITNQRSPRHCNSIVWVGRVHGNSELRWAKCAKCEK